MHPKAAYLALRGMRCYQNEQDVTMNYPVYRIIRYITTDATMLAYLGEWRQHHWWGTLNAQVEIAWGSVPDHVWGRLELSMVDNFLNSLGE